MIHPVFAGFLDGNSSYSVQKIVQGIIGFFDDRFLQTEKMEND